MAKRTTHLASAAILTIAAISASGAHATFVVNILRLGSDVVATGSGTIDRAGMIFSVATLGGTLLYTGGPTLDESSSLDLDGALLIDILELALPEPQHLLDGIGGLAVAAEALEQHSHVGMGIVHVPRERRRADEVFERRVTESQCGERDAAVVQHRGQVALQSEGAIEAGDGFCVTIEPHQDYAELDVGLHIVGQ